MKNKNSFRFKEGKFILGLPLSYKLYEYWQLCMHVFIDCSCLTSATIGNNMTSIGRLSFSDCDAPTSATIGNNMTKLVDAAYYTPRHILQYQPTFNIVTKVSLVNINSSGGI